MIKSPEKLSQANRSSQALIELWRGGIELHHAGFHFADGRSRELIRNAPSRGALEARKMDLIAGLFGKLSDGELVALGHLVEPQISNGPVAIPSHFFSILPGWETIELDDIELWGWKYKDVRIVPNHEHQSSLAQPISPEPGSGTHSAKEKRGGGRNSHYPMAKATLAALFSDRPAYSRLSAAKLIDPFNVRYLEMHAVPGVRLAPVSQRSLQDYLKWYRQELADIGKN